MFIALSIKDLGAPAERNVHWRIQLHAAPDGAGYFFTEGYKHLAPPEQRKNN